jgi:Met-zincin/Domain of unknown function (DUF5117)
MVTSRLAPACICLLLTACAAWKPPSKAVSTQSAADKQAVVSTATTQAPAFDTVIQGAERIEGLMPLWRKQDKLWIELGPADWRKAFFLSPQLTTGIGEQGLFGGLLASRWNQVGRPQWVEFRRVNQQVQLLAINSAFVAAPGSAAALGIEAAFSHSLLASVPVASATHPKRETVLVELSAMLATDVMGLGAQLQRAFRQSYALDTKQTTVTHVPGTSMASLVLQVQQHFMAASLASASANKDGASASLPSITPSGLPDPRSLFLTLRYTLSPLPEQPMSTRRADQRVGYFTTTLTDFTNDLARTPRQRWINRWSVMPKDPAAARSQPLRPLVFWLDASIPPNYRAAITEGVLEWNKAFEAIGLEQVLQVQDAPEHQPIDTVGNGQVIIRWMTNHNPGFGAIGPSHVDPRSGEILAGSVAFESLSTRAIRALRSQILSTAAQADVPEEMPHSAQCIHADQAAEQLSYALDLLGTDLHADNPQAQAFVLAYLKDVTMHEVGHVLGLRHNFKASQWRTQQELAQSDLTRVGGISASVMDYLAINLGPEGEPWGQPFQTTLGPYDYWAIEYGYKHLQGTPQEQAQALQRIADRQSQPAWQMPLDYGTDEDQSLGVDPQTQSFDLGRNPLVFASHRLRLAQRLLNSAAQQIERPQTAEGTQLPAIERAPLLRRKVLYAFRDMGRSSQVVLRQVGGLVVRRDAPDSGRALLEPVPSEQQRKALQWLLTHFLSPQQGSLPPALQRQLVPDFFERSDSQGLSTDATVPTDFSLADQWAGLYLGVLDGLMNERLAMRILDNADKVRDTDPQPLAWQEVLSQVQNHIWRKPSRHGTAPSTTEAGWQRNVQRAYVNRLSSALLRGSTRADIRSSYRAQAIKLLHLLNTPQGGHLSEQDRMHRQDCAGTLHRALDAQVPRQTP